MALLSIKMKTSIIAPMVRQWAGPALKRIRDISPFRIKAYGVKSRGEPQFSDLIAQYDVVMMKHCFPASDILEDTGKADPASPRQSLENYKAIYRSLRDIFDKNPNRLFIIWTLPPRHRLFEPSEGGKDANAARATAFSEWLKGDFLQEGDGHPNIYIWDFRALVIDPINNLIKYEYESDHDSPDSHPNELANNIAGPCLSQFIVDSMTHFAGNSLGKSARIILLCHSTGERVYKYPGSGVQNWFKRHNATNDTSYHICYRWYMSDGNMPVHYYRKWLMVTSRPVDPVLGRKA